METLAEAAKEIMGRLEKIKNKPAEPETNEGKCMNCNTDFEWSDKQWKRTCQNCGMTLIRKTKEMKEQQKIECWACLDTGVVIYKVQIENHIALYGAACILCKKGAFVTSIPKISDCVFAPPLSAIVNENKKISKEV